MLVSPVLGGTQSRGEYTSSGPERALLPTECASVVAQLRHCEADQQTFTAWRLDTKITRDHSLERPSIQVGSRQVNRDLDQSILRRTPPL